MKFERISLYLNLDCFSSEKRNYKIYWMIQVRNNRFWNSPAINLDKKLGKLYLLWDIVSKRVWRAWCYLFIIFDTSSIRHIWWTGEYGKTSIPDSWQKQCGNLHNHDKKTTCGLRAYTKVPVFFGLSSNLQHRLNSCWWIFQGSFPSNCGTLTHSSISSTFLVGKE